MIDFETFIKAYQDSSPEMKNFIDSGEIGSFCENLLSGSGFETTKKNLILVASSYVLKIIPAQDLISQLASTGLSDDFIIANLNTLKNFLSRIDNTNTTNVDSIQDQIAETEEALNSIPPVRTMEGDGQATPPETTYTSTQAAILTEKYGKVPQSGVRWETDN